MELFAGWSPGDVVDLLALIGGASGGGFALLIYRRDVTAKRTDWLYQIFSDFYEKENYKAIRRVLDYRKGEEYQQLQADAAANAPTDLHEKLADYLNFFEFVIGLQRRRRISRDELCWLFDYYITCIGSQPWLVEYAHRYGFEQICAELKRRGVRRGND